MLYAYRLSVMWDSTSFALPGCLSKFLPPFWVIICRVPVDRHTLPRSGWHRVLVLSSLHWLWLLQVSTQQAPKRLHGWSLIKCWENSLLPCLQHLLRGTTLSADGLRHTPCDSRIYSLAVPQYQPGMKRVTFWISVIGKSLVSSYSRIVLWLHNCLGTTKRSIVMGWQIVLGTTIASL